MPKKLVLLLSVLAALLAGVAGYALVAGSPPLESVAEARSSSMPAEPHLLFLAPPEAERADRGAMDDESARDRGAELVHSWKEARSASALRPIDALLVDASMLTDDALSMKDQDWLRSQFRDGVVVVGIGVEDDSLAARLGLATLRAPGEANAPIVPTGYRLIYGLRLGQKEDEDTLDNSNWLEKLLRGEDLDRLPVNCPTMTNAGGARGSLDTGTDLDLLFSRIETAIQGIYDTRAEFEKNVVECQGVEP